MYNIYKNHFSWYYLAYGKVNNLRWKTKKLLNTYWSGKTQGLMSKAKVCSNFISNAYLKQLLQLQLEYENLRINKTNLSNQETRQ